ncbi:MAG: ABC transporter permease [Ruminococcaceae bacterium]|nr:ABC transporter permease [Oscillospiraceae bacterium]
MEKVFEYLKRSISIAWKTVFFNFRQYLPFFIAIVIVQLLYGMMTVSNDNNNNVEYRHVMEQYDYHMVLKGLNDTQARYLIDDNGGAVFKSDILFDVVHMEQYRNNMTGEERYDVYLLFKPELKSSVKRFTQTTEKELAGLAEEGTSFTKSTTPLMTFEDNERANAVTFVFITILLLAVCIFLLTSLYNIRINQYKFQYGIYLTFGADFKMLFSTCFWELFVIFFVTFVPSMLLSTLISWLVYRSNGYGFLFNGLSILKTFVFTLVVILASCWTPMKIMSVKDPMGLIITEDNSNLVTSPQRSFNIFGEKFPTKYELYSLWRFRKYNVQILTTAIVFCALFIMGLYMANIYTTDLEYPRPQFEVNLNDSGFEYDEIMSRELYSMEGVRAVEINDNTMEAMDVGSHILVRKKNVLPFKNLVRYDGTMFETNGEHFRAANEILYTAMSEEQLQILEDYDYEGDLSTVLDSGYVLVGDAVSNVPTFKFHVGDTIWVGVKTGQIRSVDANVTGRVLLKDQITNFEFEYLPFTIGAVIKDIPCGSTPVIMNLENYKRVTGKTPKATSFNIYVDHDATPDGVNDLYARIRGWSHDYGDVKISNKDITLTNTVAHDKHYNELYVVISLLILCISPLVWFFSQALYYGKREKEFNILQSLGAVAKEIRQIYLQGGLSMAILSLIFSIILSYAGSYILFYIYNVMMPYFTHENVRYVFYMPWYAILTSIVMSVFCGFFSTYLPYRSYYKNRYSLENGGAGREYGADE